MHSRCRSNMRLLTSMLGISVWAVAPKLSTTLWYPSTSGRSVLRASTDARPWSCAREIVDASIAFRRQRHWIAALDWSSQLDGRLDFTFGPPGTKDGGSAEPAVGVLQRPRDAAIRRHARGTHESD